jgi:excisionase family DNA binding protein
MNQILITEINVNELLDKIGQVIDSKLDKVSSNNKVNQPDLLSRKEVSTLLKISLPTLNEWTKLGWLQSYKIGNRVLYKANEVSAALENVSKNKFKKYIK